MFVRAFVSLKKRGCVMRRRLLSFRARAIMEWVWFVCGGVVVVLHRVVAGVSLVCTAEGRWAAFLRSWRFFPSL